MLRRFESYRSHCFPSETLRVCLTKEKWADCTPAASGIAGSNPVHTHCPWAFFRKTKTELKMLGLYSGVEKPGVSPVS